MPLGPAGRISLFGIAFGLGIAACVSFDLEGRRFRCEQDPSICGGGMTCGADGFCVASQDGSVPGDASLQDGAAADATLGEICENGDDDDGDGDVDCADGECPQGTTCGNGCICNEPGQPEEFACGDMMDNDGDDDIDCNDTDCPDNCGPMASCCPNGECRMSC